MIEERDPIDPAQPEAEIKDKKQTKTAKNHKPHIYIRDKFTLTEMHIYSCRLWVFAFYYYYFLFIFNIFWDFL